MADHGALTRKMADLCKDACPVCVHARKKGGGLMHRVLRVEAKVCPACRAYEKVYGVPAWENPPED